MNFTNIIKLNSMALVCKRTIPTEGPLLAGKVSANFCRQRMSRGQCNESPWSLISVFQIRSRYFHIQVALQLYSGGWVNLTNIISAKNSLSGKNRYFVQRHIRTPTSGSTWCPMRTEIPHLQLCHSHLNQILAILFVKTNENHNIVTNIFP
jgi:hypothetical protein